MAFFRLPRRRLNDF
jgi:hypothetical protein